MRISVFCAIALAAVLSVSAPGACFAQNASLQTVRPPSAVAMKEHRVALVIGNSAYRVGPLNNPVNDATDIAAKLRALEFDVVERTNLKTSQIGRTLREFRSKLTAGSVALVFYAGHGLQIKGENYLPTVDAEIEGEEDVFNQSLGLRQLLDVLEDSKTRLNLVFLDACRNNPFLRRFRSASDGLARVAAPTGTLISYATRPGSVASDGEGRNGLYTAQLLEVMDTPNQVIELGLKRVVSAVKAASKGQQEPWMEGSIEGDFYFQQRADPYPQGPAPVDQRIQQDAIDRAVQEAVKRTNEQAARDRAEMQAAMEKVIRQALEEQNARIESERRAAQALSPPKTPTSSVPSSTSGSLELQQLAIASPVPAAATIASGSGANGIGEDAVYRSTSFGKQQILTVRTPAAGVEPGRHELYWGTVMQEFDSTKTFVAGAPNEGGILFAPRWRGGLGELNVKVGEGGGHCGSQGVCRVSLKPVGEERLIIPAGSFDAVRLEGSLDIQVLGYAVSGKVSVWYARSGGRLLKQAVDLRGARQWVFVEVLELERVGKMLGGLGMPSDVGADLNRRTDTSVGGLNFDKVNVGDEWEYLATDNILGKTRKLIGRVVAVSAGKGILEEFLVDGRRSTQWVADGRPALMSIIPDLGPLFMSYWPSGGLLEPSVVNWGLSRLASISVSGKVGGTERITVPAGSFDTIRIELNLRILTNQTATARIDVWYSEALQRVIRQNGKSFGGFGSSSGGMFRFDDTFELAVMRAAAR